MVGSYGRQLLVEDEAGQRQVCHVRSRRQDAVVGDMVDWSPSGDSGVVESVHARRNLLVRRDERRTKAFAANLDAMWFMVASEPVFSDSQLTRALVAAHEAGVASTIVLNKTDLPAVDSARERLQPYRSMGHEVLEVSLRWGWEAEQIGIHQRLQGRATLVLGASGVGKSSLINRLVPGAAAQVGELSKALRTGRHTTTATTWHVLPGPAGGAIIDSPGFQEFGLRHLQAGDLATAMPDLAQHLGACRFANCSHLQEPGCSVRLAADSGLVAPSRWRVYREIYEELAGSREGRA